MPTVPLGFIPPSQPNIVKLHIFESDSADGAFGEIDSTTEVGTYPDYISFYETQKANNVSDWFAIIWEDSKGGLTDLSSPLKGGQKTLIAEVVERVLIRSPELNKNIVTEEAAVIIERALAIDPFITDYSDLSRKQIIGLVYVTLASVLTSEVITSGYFDVDYTAGLVSERANSNLKSVSDRVDRLEKKGLKFLGLWGSIIGTIDYPSDLTNRNQIIVDGVVIDHSRLLSAVTRITEDIVLYELP